MQGCSPSSELLTTNAIDPAGGLSREDYLALRQRSSPDNDKADKKPGTIPPIPKMPEDEFGAPSTNSPLNKLVSVTVTDSVPVRDVLMELVRKTGANLELDPRVQGSVIVTAHDQPFGQVLKRICALANLRYTTDGNFIHIEPDDPYQRSYRLNYLSLARKTSSDTSIATNVFDVDVGGNGNTSNLTNGGNRSSSTTQNNSTAKFPVSRTPISGRKPKNPLRKFLIPAIRKPTEKSITASISKPELLRFTAIKSNKTPSANILLNCVKNPTRKC
jgi:hypothetical protein